MITLTKEIKIYFTLLLFLLLTSPAIYAGEVFDYLTYYDYTEIPVTIAWDTDDGAEYYKFELYHYDHKSVYVNGSTQQTQVTIDFPKSGHYIFRVKSCTSKEPSDTTDLTHEGNDWCSVFSESTDSQKAAPKSWWIYKHISPPGTIKTED